MKRMLPLISSVVLYTISTTVVLVSAPKSASAFCVHNLTGSRLEGTDVKKRGYDNKWFAVLPPDAKDCCPGNNQECQNVTIQIQPQVPGDDNGNGICEGKPGDSGLVEVRYKDRQMVCNII